MDLIYTLEGCKKYLKCKKAWHVPHVSLKVVSQSWSRGRELREDQAHGMARAGVGCPWGMWDKDPASPSRPQLDEASDGAGPAGMEGALMNGTLRNVLMPGGL